MFEIGFPELVLIAIVGLLVIGPERLPETLRTIGLWLGRMRRSFTAVKAEIEKEIGMDEVKRQLHNEAIMDEMKRIEAEMKNTAKTAKSAVSEGLEAADIPRIDPRAQASISDTIAAQDSITPPPAPTELEATPGDRQALAEESADRTGVDQRVDESATADDAGKTPPDDRDHSDAGAATTSEIRRG